MHIGLAMNKTSSLNLTRPRSTLHQMRHAPIGSLYVWCCDLLSYPEKLSQKIGREDLVIVSIDELDSDFLEGLNLDLTIDHGTYVTRAQYALFEQYYHQLRKQQRGK